MTRGMKPGERPRIPVLIVLSLTGGGLMLAIALILVINTARFVGRARVAEGTFIGSEEGAGGSRGGTRFYPRFRFLTADGQTIVTTSRIGSAEQPYANGRQVVLLYDPADPQDARERGFVSLWLIPTELAVGGLFFVALALSIVKVMRRVDPTAS